AYDSYTKLMLHCDGADASTTFTDDSASGHTVTPVADAQIDTAQSKFGGASALFDGTGDYLSVPNHADFNFGSDDFTVDLQFRPANTSGNKGIISMSDASNFNWVIYQSNANARIYISSNGSSWNIVSAGTIGTLVANTWHHLEIGRSGNDFYTFLDGVESGLGTSSASALYAGTSLLRIGTNGLTGQNVNGHIDEVRISNGICRHTSGFTPPTSAYS
ncbi:MAG: LamG domain-containing protein, partial [Planctomycetes bacterium]|nr:LamG domain-containing protein [Planctomycetota bacterium]